MKIILYTALFIANLNLNAQSVSSIAEGYIDNYPLKYSINNKEFQYGGVKDVLIKIKSNGEILILGTAFKKQALPKDGYSFIIEIYDDYDEKPVAKLETNRVSSHGNYYPDKKEKAFNLKLKTSIKSILGKRISVRVVRSSLSSFFKEERGMLKHQSFVIYRKLNMNNFYKHLRNQNITNPSQFWTAYNFLVD